MGLLRSRKAFLFAGESEQDYLRIIEKAGDADAVAKTAGDEKLVFVKAIAPGDIVREKPEAGAQNSAEKGETDDAAVGMAAENGINIKLRVFLCPVISVTQKYAEVIAALCAHFFNNFIG